MKHLIIITLLITSFIACADESTLRYRGSYTLGHEVNIFCPEISSQCYWLNPETTSQQRQKLKQLIADHSRKPYDSICLVLEGEISRTSDLKKNIGFASDYDGLFTVDNIFGLCGETSIITQGDLQHHRWVLESINGNTIDTKAIMSKTPELDFGEKMTVSGNTACNNFSGQAALQGDQFVIHPMSSTTMSCSPAQNDLEQLLTQVYSNGATITIDDKKYLLLKTDKTQLKYSLKDWVN